jgi:broad specificity phosphatase PhoE
MKFAKIYLVRHGGVVNKKNIIYGYLPLKLSPKGEKEAKKAAIFLRDKKIAAIFSSPQKRAQETAKILSKIISKNKLKIQTIKDLRESGWGHFLEGLTWEQARKKYSKETLFYSRRPSKVEKGESLQKMAARMLKIVQKVIKKYPGQNFILVSHRDPILALLLKISRRSFDDLHQVQHLCDTGSVLEVELIGKRLINKNF